VSLWRRRDFTVFWLPMVAVLALDVSAGQLGALRFAEYLPFLAFTLVFGVLADRNRRRPLMIASNAARDKP
jgi:hypothetical protein